MAALCREVGNTTVPVLAKNPHGGFGRTYAMITLRR
jgi:hypothetical protein